MEDKIKKKELKLNGTQKEIIKAYYYDSLFTFVLDVIVLLVLLTVYILGSDVKGMSIFIVVVAIIYILFSILLQHRNNILLFIDNRKGDVETVKVKVLKSKEELAWNGYLWHSPILHFYPKEMNMGKRKILVELPDGKRMYIRTLMSAKRSKFFWEFILNEENTEFQVKFFKRSKVVIEITEPECKDKKRFEQIYKFNNSF